MKKRSKKQQREADKHAKVLKKLMEKHRQNKIDHLKNIIEAEFEACGPRGAFWLTHVIATHGIWHVKEVIEERHAQEAEESFN